MTLELCHAKVLEFVGQSGLLLDWLLLGEDRFVFVDCLFDLGSGNFVLGVYLCKLAHVVSELQLLFFEPLTDILWPLFLKDAHVFETPESLLAELTDQDSVLKPVEVDVLVETGRHHENARGLCERLYHLNRGDRLPVRIDIPHFLDLFFNRLFHVVTLAGLAQLEHVAFG